VTCDRCCRIPERNGLPLPHPSRILVDDSGDFMANFATIRDGSNSVTAVNVDQIITIDQHQGNEPSAYCTIHMANGKKVPWTGVLEELLVELSK
jgi:hypothetical protein